MRVLVQEALPIHMDQRYTRIPAQVLAGDCGDLRVELHRGQRRLRVEPRQDPGSGHAGARAEIERPRAGLGRRQRAQQRASPRSAGHVEADGQATLQDLGDHRRLARGAAARARPPSACSACFFKLDM